MVSRACLPASSLLRRGQQTQLKKQAANKKYARSVEFAACRWRLQGTEDIQQLIVEERETLNDVGNSNILLVSYVVHKPDDLGRGANIGTGNSPVTEIIGLKPKLYTSSLFVRASIMTILYPSKFKTGTKYRLKVKFISQYFNIKS